MALVMLLTAVAVASVVAGLKIYYSGPRVAPERIAPEDLDLVGAEECEAWRRVSRRTYQGWKQQDEFYRVAAYKKAISGMSNWLDAPDEVLEDGFFPTIVYWLGRTETILRDDWVPYRIALIGNYGTDLRLKRDINRFLSEDPYGTHSFIEYGVHRKEVRSDIEVALMVSIIDWLMERFQDALLTEELDPGLFHKGDDSTAKRKARIDQFVELIRSAIGAPVAKP